MKPKLKICIDGIIGAGKSTLVKSLKNDYNCYEEPIEKWSLLSKFYNNMKVYSAPFQFQVLFSQYDQQNLFKTQTSKNEDIVIVERCPWTSFNIFSKMLIEDGVFDKDYIETYEKFHNILSYEVDHFIFLKVDHKQAFKRVEARNRRAEQKLNIEYLHRLEKQYDKMLLFQEPPNTSGSAQRVHVVDASQTTEEIEKTVREILNSIIHYYRNH
ncbi:Thymidine kinase [Armadillidium vulgare iridescent virus]|uniref:Thymidine kinase n=1 Tax=Armadillidium vulgare iridescent virus TaxID=72201 RepID=A0A068QL38_9VIRU|nr:Thymidine kinase [Armadillidium vulgare iridescent virus]CCV02440.1 Thymidine kinase [Armadillidium vulgare iridescent virus]